MTITCLNHLAIICGNYENSKRFYTTILPGRIIAENYREDRNSYKLDIAMPGQFQIELFSFPHPPERPTQPEARGLRHLAFTVTDLDQDVRELTSKGITVEPIRIDPTTGKRFTFFADPDGLPIELYEL